MSTGTSSTSPTHTLVSLLFVGGASRFSNHVASDGFFLLSVELLSLSHLQRFEPTGSV